MVHLLVHPLRDSALDRLPPAGSSVSLSYSITSNPRVPQSGTGLAPESGEPRRRTPVWRSRRKRRTPGGGSGARHRLLGDGLGGEGSSPVITGPPSGIRWPLERGDPGHCWRRHGGRLWHDLGEGRHAPRAHETERECRAHGVAYQWTAGSEEFGEPSRRAGVVSARESAGLPGTLEVQDVFWNNRGKRGTRRSCAGG